MAVKGNVGNIDGIVTDIQRGQQPGFAGFAANIVDGARRKLTSQGTADGFQRHREQNRVQEKLVRFGILVLLVIFQEKQDSTETIIIQFHKKHPFRGNCNTRNKETQGNDKREGENER